METINNLKNTYTGKTAIIIGSGEHKIAIKEENDIFICLNDSIRRYRDKADFLVLNHTIYLRDLGFAGENTKIIIDKNKFVEEFKTNSYENLLRGYNVYYFDEIIAGHTVLHKAILLTYYIGCINNIKFIGCDGTTQNFAECDLIRKKVKIEESIYRKWWDEAMTILKELKGG
jgi:hypothetical protein